MNRPAPTLLRRADVFRVDLPLAEPFEHASSGKITVLEEVVVRLESEAGVVGWGEVRGNAPYVTGDTPGRLVAVLRDALLPAIMGHSAHSSRVIHEVMTKAIVGNSGAKAAIDLALHDLLGNALGVPVHQLIGGARVDKIASDASVPFCSPEEAASRTGRYLDQGFRYIKVRVGLDPFDRDVQRVGAVREAIDSHPASADTTLAVDANQAWTVKEAIRRIRILSEFQLGWAEQPVRSDDLRGMREVRDGVDVDIMADESCASKGDLIRVLAMGAADRCHFKIIKAGGIQPLVEMMAIADAFGMPYMIGQMDEGMLASGAAVHVAAVGSAASGEIWGFQRVARQPFSGLVVDQGCLHVPSAPGIGVEVDEDGLTHIARLES